MSLTILQFVVSAAVIVIAGTYLTRYADAIADLTGLGRLLVGSILLAGATSFPELSVDLSAVRLGEVDMAVGNLIGSSLFNLLILGILDLSHHSRGRMLSRASAAHALSATLRPEVPSRRPSRLLPTSRPRRRSSMTGPKTKSHSTRLSGLRFSGPACHCSLGPHFYSFQPTPNEFQHLGPEQTQAPCRQAEE